MNMLRHTTPATSALVQSQTGCEPRLQTVALDDQTREVWCGAHDPYPRKPWPIRRPRRVATPTLI